MRFRQGNSLTKEHCPQHQPDKSGKQNLPTSG
uniref:Uncharacterized protein n=1 Tax=Rhizophora mucronata TaxID=61149 RepID=A0A2P2MPZ0_RHIMU